MPLLLNGVQLPRSVTCRADDEVGIPNKIEDCLTEATMETYMNKNGLRYKMNKTDKEKLLPKLLPKLPPKLPQVTHAFKALHPGVWRVLAVTEKGQRAWCFEAFPFIVNMYATFQDEMYLYMVLEYCPGGELFTLLQKRKNPFSLI